MSGGDGVQGGTEPLWLAAGIAGATRPSVSWFEYETAFANRRVRWTMEVFRPGQAASEAGWVPVDTSLQLTATVH